MKESTRMADDGHINRTGMATSSHAEAMGQVPAMTHPAAGDGSMKAMHAAYAHEAHALGTVPPPGSVKGAAKAAADALKGNKAIALVDRMAERLAFERTGVRLYDALLEKLDAAGSFAGGPDREALVTIRGEELEHARMLAQSLEEMGADPTAMTPSADLVAVEGAGIGAVLGDPRTTVGQGLHALLVAELADGEGWTLLRQLADDMGHSGLAERFAGAARDEERHLASVRGWVQAHARDVAGLA